MLDEEPCFSHLSAFMAEARNVVKWSIPMSTALTPCKHLGQATVCRMRSFLYAVAWLRLSHPHIGLDCVIRALTE